MSWIRVWRWDLHSWIILCLRVCIFLCVHTHFVRKYLIRERAKWRKKTTRKVLEGGKEKNTRDKHKRGRRRQRRERRKSWRRDDCEGWEVGGWEIKANTAYHINAFLCFHFSAVTPWYIAVLSERDNGFYVCVLYGCPFRFRPWYRVSVQTRKILMYAIKVSSANRREFRMSPKPFVEKRLVQCCHQILLGVPYIKPFLEHWNQVFL
jgi:hypothetical protein